MTLLLLFVVVVIHICLYIIPSCSCSTTFSYWCPISEAMVKLSASTNQGLTMCARVCWLGVGCNESCLCF